MPFGFSFEEAVLLVAILFPVALSIYCALRVLRSRDLVFLGKAIWLLILLLPLLGPALYFLIQYKKDEEFITK